VVNDAVAERPGSSPDAGGGESPGVDGHRFISDAGGTDIGQTDEKAPRGSRPGDRDVTS
jgi:hypothetical protein